MRYSVSVSPNMRRQSCLHILSRKWNDHINQDHLQWKCRGTFLARKGTMANCHWNLFSANLPSPKQAFPLFSICRYIFSAHSNHMKLKMCLQIEDSIARQLSPARKFIACASPTVDTSWFLMQAEIARTFLPLHHRAADLQSERVVRRRMLLFWVLCYTGRSSGQSMFSRTT